MTDQPESTEQPEIQIDDDWKAQAQAERQQLSEELDQPGAEEAQPQGMPPADFKTLISTMVTQALFAMGAIPDPNTGQRMVHIELAQHHIDMLGVLEEKTKGNLDEEEEKLLSGALHELRMNFLQVQQQVADQIKAQQAGGGVIGGGEAGGEPSGGGAGGIITP